MNNQSINQSLLSIKFSLDDISIKPWHYHVEFSSISIMSAWLYVYEGDIWRMQWDHRSCHALPRFWRLRFSLLKKGGKHRIFSLRVVTWDANMFSWSRGIKLVFFLIDCSFSQAIRLAISEKNISIMLADASPSADGVRNKIVLIRRKILISQSTMLFFKDSICWELKTFQNERVWFQLKSKLHK